MQAVPLVCTVSMDGVMCSHVRINDLVHYCAIDSSGKRALFDDNAVIYVSCNMDVWRPCNKLMETVACLYLFMSCTPFNVTCVRFCCNLQEPVTIVLFPLVRSKK